MTREEIVKEAQEQVNYCTPLYPECFIQGYLAGAEPRENKIADIKANCDLAIEGRDIKIMELEQQIEQIEKVSDYNADQLAQAKEIIKNIIRVTWGEGWNYSLDVKVKAEQFLKEIEK